MAEDRITVAELEGLSELWKGRLEENLAEATFSASELNELAERHRALALVAEGPGQRRAAITIAERYETRRGNAPEFAANPFSPPPHPNESAAA